MDVLDLENKEASRGYALPPVALRAWREFWARSSEHTNRYTRCRSAFLAGYDSAENNQSELAKLTAEKSQILGRYDALASGLRLYETQVKHQAERINVLEIANQDLRRRLNEAENEVSILREENGELRAEIESLEEENGRVSEEVVPVVQVNIENLVFQFYGGDLLDR